MNHKKTHQTNPMAPWDPLDAPLDPQGLPAPPIDPLGPLNRSLGLMESPWPQIECIKNHNQMSLLILLNILPLPLDPLRPCRPTPCPLGPCRPTS